MNFGLVIRDGISNRGGTWACCPIKRETVTLEFLSGCEVEQVEGYGFNFEDVFGIEPLRRWFDPELPENVMRAQAECEASESSPRIRFSHHLWENFYSRAAIRGMSAEMREAVAYLRTGRVEEVPYERVRACIARRDYEPADVADFYEELAERLEQMTELDEHDCIVAFWGP